MFLPFSPTAFRLSPVIPNPSLSTTSTSTVSPPACGGNSRGWNKIMTMTVKLVTASLLALLAVTSVGCKKDEKSNAAPVANAGPDILARMRSEVVLSGRDSYDDDGPVMSYHWRQLAGPEVTPRIVNT